MIGNEKSERYLLLLTSDGMPVFVTKFKDILRVSLSRSTALTIHHLLRSRRLDMKLEPIRRSSTEGRSHALLPGLWFSPLHCPWTPLSTLSLSLRSCPRQLSLFSYHSFWLQMILTVGWQMVSVEHHSALISHLLRTVDATSRLVSYCCPSVLLCRPAQKCADTFHKTYPAVQEKLKMYYCASNIVH